MPAISVNHKNFSTEVLASSQPVLLDFWAPWCGPCRMVAPILEEIAKEHEGRVRIGKINIDEEPGLAGQFGVMSIPTLVLVKNGQPVSASVGLKPKHKIKEMLE